jgi:two-component system, response regulator YesN
MTSVLVVDADDDVRASIGEILQRSGITVALASRGLEALALLRRVPVDVVLVDLRLPDFAEVDILRALRNELARIPVIVTGVESPGVAIEAGRLGAAAYLEKPLRAEPLIAAVLSQLPHARSLAWIDGPPSEWTHPQVVHAVRAIDDRYWDVDLNVRSMARELGLSTEHLCRVLKRQTGGTFVTLLRRTRVRAACRLLASTTLCMKEIAGRVGFSSASRFARDFKKLCGISPSEYRLDALQRGAREHASSAHTLASES